MSAENPSTAVRALAWFGWTGAPLAWAVQHVLGFGVTQASCGLQSVQRDVPVHGLALAASVAVFAVAAAALAAAAYVLRATDGATELPGERVHFMAIVGLAITPLFALIMVLNAVGVLSQQGCVQS